MHVVLLVLVYNINFPKEIDRETLPPPSLNSKFAHRWGVRPRLESLLYIVTILFIYYYFEFLHFHCIMYIYIIPDIAFVNYQALAWLLITEICLQMIIIAFLLYIWIHYWLRSPIFCYILILCIWYIPCMFTKDN